MCRSSVTPPPQQTLFGQKLKWPSSSFSSSSSSSSTPVKEAFRRRLLPGIKVRYIEDVTHFLRSVFFVVY